MKQMAAYVSVGAVKSARAMATYLEYGRGSTKTMHKLMQTNRMAAMYCDAPSLGAFVLEAERLARTHSRKNEAYSIIVSHPEGRYDKDNPDDMRAMVRNDTEGARRAYPNSKLLAIGHTDGKGHDGCGGKPHTHVVAINHDLSTGKAITQNRMAVKVRGIYNELGAELGWSHTEVTFEKTATASRERRQLEAIAERAKSPETIKAAEKALTEVGAFEQETRALLLTARSEATGATWTQWRADFVAKAADAGITVEVTPAGRRVPHTKTRAKSEGVLFKRRNPATSRGNSLKASKLDPQLKMAGLREAFAQYQEQMRLEAEAEREALVETTPETVETVETVETTSDAAPSRLSRVNMDLGDTDLTAGYVPAVGQRRTPAPTPVEAPVAAPEPVTVTAPSPVEAPVTAVEPASSPAVAPAETAPAAESVLSEEQIARGGQRLQEWRDEVQKPLGNRAAIDLRERQAAIEGKQRHDELTQRLAKIDGLLTDQRPQEAFALVESGEEADREAAKKRAKRDQTRTQFMTPTLAEVQAQDARRKPGED